MGLVKRVYATPFRHRSVAFPASCLRALLAHYNILVAVISFLACHCTSHYRLHRAGKRVAVSLISFNQRGRQICFRFSIKASGIRLVTCSDRQSWQTAAFLRHSIPADKKFAL